MSTLMIVSQVGLWLLVGFLFLMMFALTRQIGLLHRRLAPSGARMLSDGPGIGEPAPEVDSVDLQGRRVTLAAARAKLTLLVFVSPGCSACAELIPAVRSLWRAERRHLEVIILSLVADDAKNREFILSHKIESVPVVTAPDIVSKYQGRMPPYAVLVGTDGLVKSKGLVNHLEHLESLLTAARLGRATIESYVQHRGASTLPSAQGGVIEAT